MKKFWTALFLSAVAFISNAGAIDQVTAPLTNFVQKAGDTRSALKFQADCAAGVALDSCVGAPTPKGCGPGKHWSTQGSGIAHCVADDPICTGDNYLTHDALGNPSCVAPVYTNGVETRVLACSSGYQGAGTNQQRSLTTNTYTGVTTYGAWATTYSDCTPTPPPTCANGASDYPTCTPPTCSNGGTNWPTCTPPPPPTCANGASNYPTCTFPPPPTCANGASDYPICTPPVAACSSSDVVVSSTPCGGGQVGGPIEQHQTVSCPGSTVGSYTSGTCSTPPPPTCANGATNYPTCTLAATPPPTCPDTVTWCVEDRGQSGDPRDDWYTTYVRWYEGPSCTMQEGQLGQRSGVDGGCL